MTSKTSKPLAGKTALLTGAGSGIGRCLANELAQQGAQLILTDIDQAALDETINLYQLQQQVLGTIISNFLVAGDIERTVEEARALSARIDILYNNAGMMVLGQVRNLHWEDVERLRTVNLDAPLKLTHLLLPQMIEHGGGHIAFTCSASAVATPPGAAAYGLTKAGVQAFSEALRAEVKRHNISVTTVCPGFVHTPLAEKSEYRDQRCREQTTSVPKFVGSSPEKVARLSVRAMLKRKGLVVIGLDEKFKRATKQWWPWLYERINLLMAKHLID